MRARKIIGRKRHIAVVMWRPYRGSRYLRAGADGRLPMVDLTPADISDSAGGQMIPDGLRKKWPWMTHLFADGGYGRTQGMNTATFMDVAVEIIKRSDTAKGFAVLARRWVVERAFERMTRWRRLVRDFEHRVDVSKAMIHIAMASPLLRRLAHP